MSKIHTSIALSICLSFTLMSCSDDQSSTGEPNYCSPAVAKIAADKTITPILLEISRVDTRIKGCAKLDDILRDSTSSYAFESSRPSDCEWGFETENQPYHFIIKLLEPRGDDLSNLCDWKRRDAKSAGRRLQDEGAVILNTLPKNEREQLQREWDSYAPNQ